MTGHSTREGPRAAGPAAPARPTGWALELACGVAALVVAGAFLAIVGDLVAGGVAELGPGYLLGSVEDAGRAGGIAPLLVSTAALLGICLALALPIGLGAALFLAELAPAAPGASRVVRLSLDVLAGIPSIVFGLFGSAFFCGFLGLGFSLLAGGATLACMVLPLFIRAAEEAIRAVPRERRDAAAALGLSRLTTLRRLVLPEAAPGILVGAILGIGRALAETAALIFTSGYVPRMPTSWFDSGRSLSIHVYDLAMNVPGGDARAHAAALVLVALLLATNLAAAALARAYGSRVVRP